MMDVDVRERIARILLVKAFMGQTQDVRVNVLAELAKETVNDNRLRQNENRTSPDKPTVPRRSP